jgi:IS30 family transposase
MSSVCQSAETLNKAAIDALNALPLVFRKTITVNNGREFARHQKLEAATSMQFYFAEPYSNSQRGLYESTNGLLRQYFPQREWLL